MPWPSLEVEAEAAEAVVAEAVEVADLAAVVADLAEEVADLAADLAAEAVVQRAQLESRDPAYFLSVQSL